MEHFKHPTRTRSWGETHKSLEKHIRILETFILPFQVFQGQQLDHVPQFCESGHCKLLTLH